MNKICVYAICKNEAAFVDKWLDSMSEADYIVVLDTGSEDNTYELLKQDKRVYRVEQKTITPWRFDVARNESLKLVPEDANILLCTDLDEILEKYLEEAKKHFLNNFKEYVEGVKTYGEELKELKQKLYYKEQKLQAQEYELAQRESKISENSNEIISQMLTKFGLDLKPNQKVYVIYKRRDRSICSNCSGQGTIEKLIGEITWKAQCPECGGNGSKYDYSYQITSGTVSDISVRLYWNVRSQELKKDLDYNASYNIWVNLVRGNPFKEDSKSFKREDIYLTEEEAQKALEELEKSKSLEEK